MNRKIIYILIILYEMQLIYFFIRNKINLSFFLSMTVVMVLLIIAIKLSKKEHNE